MLLCSLFLQLIPSSFVVPDGQGFYFQYSLFGNNVSSDIFSDLLQPNFSPERASVRINSQLHVIRVFLQNFPGIKVSTCTNLKVLTFYLIIYCHSFDVSRIRDYQGMYTFCIARDMVIWDFMCYI